MQFNEILTENKKRRERLFEKYNPLTGEGSKVPRFKLKLSRAGKEFYLLPMSMKNLELIKEIIKVNSLTSFIKKEHGEVNNGIFDLYIKAINKLRIKHDFEYWAYTNITIRDKESGEEIPFKLNSPQRKYIAELESMRIGGIPIRAELLKARQWGGSTATQIYMFWFQVELKVNWNSAIVGNVESQASIIRGMFTLAAKKYPKESGTVTLKPYEHTVKNRIVVETGSLISIGSMEKPEGLRTLDIKCGHLSEVGLWRETQGKKPRDLIQSIKGTIPNIPDTIIVEESTAKGIGNYFHQQWLRCIRGEINYRPVFVPWFEIEIYQTHIVKSEYKSFVESMNDYEWFLWKSGATLEGIKWYRAKLKDDFNGDKWVMMSEFPTTDVEAFQSTGRRVFPPNYVINMRELCKRPSAKGEIYADGQKGDDAVKNMAFQEMLTGNLWVWSFPDKSIRTTNRYAISVDIGGKGADADFSVISVFDRYWMIDGGVPEIVATWRGHVDQDLLAWIAVQVASFYNNGLLIFENNSLRKKNNPEGSGFLTVLNEVSESYDNLYYKIDLQRVQEGLPTVFGFHTNTATKPMVINTLKAAMRDGGYVERDERACDEYDTYEYKQDGTIGAKDGSHDDITMSRAIGLHVSIFDMEPVKVLEDTKRKKKRQNKSTEIKSEASF